MIEKQPIQSVDSLKELETLVEENGLKLHESEADLDLVLAETEETGENFTHAFEAVASREGRLRLAEDVSSCTNEINALAVIKLGSLEAGRNDPRFSSFYTAARKFRKALKQARREAVNGNEPSEEITESMSRRYLEVVALHDVLVNLDLESPNLQIEQSVSLERKTGVDSQETEVDAQEIDQDEGVQKEKEDDREVTIEQWQLVDQKVAESDDEMLKELYNGEVSALYSEEKEGGRKIGTVANRIGSVLFGLVDGNKAAKIREDITNSVFNKFVYKLLRDLYNLKGEQAQLIKQRDELVKQKKESDAPSKELLNVKELIHQKAGELTSAESGVLLATKSAVGEVVLKYGPENNEEGEDDVMEMFDDLVEEISSAEEVGPAKHDVLAMMDELKEDNSKTS